MNTVNGFIGQNQIPQSIKVIFDKMGDKQGLAFNYGSTVAEALNQYLNKAFDYPTPHYFTYNDILINENNNMKVEGFFNKNDNNIVLVSFMAMMSSPLPSIMQG